MTLILHGHWRSGAAYRVRIALNLKGLAFEQVTYDLSGGAHKTPAYRAINPQGFVPALQVDRDTIIQSAAILEWLEERFPEPALLPAAARDRATIRSMAGLVGTDIHPMSNLRVVAELKSAFDATPAQIEAWRSHWMREGFTALETLVERHGQGFAFGATPTIADCYLIPQLFSADRFNIDVRDFPRLREVADSAANHPAFQAAHPGRQPDRKG